MNPSSPDELKEIWNNCPYYRLVGMSVLEVGGGTATLQLDVSPDHAQAYGTAHGGVVAGLLDAAMGLAIAGVIPAREGCATVEMKANFMRPVLPGPLTAVGRVLHTGRRLVVAVSEAHDQQGRCVAACQGTFSRFDQEAAQ